MTLPKNAELLGSNSEELEIKGLAAHTLVRFTDEGRRKLLAGLPKTAAESSRSQLYLVLENIRGTNDASVLNISISLPEDARPGEHRDLVAGAVGLYGLRRASLGTGQNRGSGLSFVLNITRLLSDLLETRSLDANAICVSIAPNRQLGNSADIVVGRVSIVRIATTS
jgi:tyrosinase